MPLEQEWAAEALFRLADWTNCTGEAYFCGLVRGLADVLSVRWVYLSRLHPLQPGHVQVVAGWADGGPAANIEYDLAHTPCAEVLAGTSCFFPTGVAGLFPEDQMLSDLGVDSYAGSPLRAADGQAQGLIVIMHDRPIDASRCHPCTILGLVAGRAAAELERSRVEAQLREREEQIRFLSESTPALLWRATPDGRLDYLSPRAAEYCGTTIDALLGHGYVSHMHPDDVARKLRLWNLARNTGQPFEAEYRLRGVDGTYRWQLTRALPERDETGAITRWYGSVVDVDDRKRAEEALREADRRKDEFLAMLAHELRNPLAPIRHSLAVQARSGDEVTVSREMRETMERQVKHLVRLVDDLLDVSRLTTGQITLRRQPVDVRDIVGDAIETCREMIEAKGHRVTTDLPADALMVDGDRIRLVQVVTNILNNAAKFTAAGGDVDDRGRLSRRSDRHPRARHWHWDFRRSPAAHLRSLLSERPVARPRTRRSRRRTHAGPPAGRPAWGDADGRERWRWRRQRVSHRAPAGDRSAGHGPRRSSGHCVKPRSAHTAARAGRGRLR